SSLWHAALDSFRQISAESAFVFGDSTRRADAGSLAKPSDPATLLRPIVERSLGAGHPLTLVTDGELDDPDAVRSLPSGSRILVIPRAAPRALAPVSHDLP